MPIVQNHAQKLESHNVTLNYCQLFIAETISRKCEAKDAWRFIEYHPIVFILPWCQTVEYTYFKIQIYI